MPRMEKIHISFRIKFIQQELGLSQTAFAEQVGVTRDGLKNIYRTKGSPRIEVIERIAQLWPEYTVWLATGLDPNEVLNTEQKIPQTTELPSTVAKGLLNKPVTTYNIIAKNTSSDVNKFEWPSTVFEELIFLQGDIDNCELAAMLVFKDYGLYKNANNPNTKSVLLVTYGELYFVPGHGDSPKPLKLNDFTKWLKAKFPEVIPTSSLFFVSSRALLNLEKSLKVQSSIFKSIDETKTTVIESFSKWKTDNS